MTEVSSPIDPDNPPPGIDTTVAHPARVYDYILGGVHHFPVDRELGDQMALATGGLHVLRAYARANRGFLDRAVRYLVHEAGVRQFIDIGTGIPSDDNVHGVAQRAAGDSRVVYVDNDPLVLAHANVLLQSTSEGTTAYINGDLRKPRSILLRAAATLDFDEPIAVMLIAILHMLGDDAAPYDLVSELMADVPSGSYLVITHMATDLEADKMAELARAPERVNQRLPFAVAVRPLADVARFLDGLDLVDPGVVPVDRWRPDPGAEPPAVVSPLYGAVGRKR